MRATFEALLDGVPNLANVVLVVVGAYRVQAGAATVGDVASFVYLFTLLVWPLRLIGFVLGELPRSLAGWTRIHGVLDDAVPADPATTVGRRIFIHRGSWLAERSKLDSDCFTGSWNAASNSLMYCPSSTIVCGIQMS